MPAKFVEVADFTGPRKKAAASTSTGRGPRSSRWATVSGPQEWFLQLELYQPRDNRVTMTVIDQDGDELAVTGGVATLDTARVARRAPSPTRTPAGRPCIELNGDRPADRTSAWSTPTWACPSLAAARRGGALIGYRAGTRLRRMRAARGDEEPVRAVRARCPTHPRSSRCLDVEAPPLEQRWRHWAHSLTAGPRLAGHGRSWTCRGGPTARSRRCEAWLVRSPAAGRRSSSTAQVRARCGWRVERMRCTASSTMRASPGRMRAELDEHPNASVRVVEPGAGAQPSVPSAQGRSRRAWTSPSYVGAIDDVPWRRSTWSSSTVALARPAWTLRRAAGRRRAHRVRQQSASALPGRDHAVRSRRAGLRGLTPTLPVPRADVACSRGPDTARSRRPRAIAASATSASTSNARDVSAMASAASPPDDGLKVRTRTPSRTPAPAGAGTKASPAAHAKPDAADRGRRLERTDRREGRHQDCEVESQEQPHQHNPRTTLATVLRRRHERPAHARRS